MTLPDEPKHSALRAALRRLLVVLVLAGVVPLGALMVLIQIQGVARSGPVPGRNDIIALAAGLERFRQLYGAYPPSSDGSEATAEQLMLRALTGRARWTSSAVPTGDGRVREFESVSMREPVPEWGTVFAAGEIFTLGPDRDAPGADEPVVLDPWGNPFIYHYATLEDLRRPGAERGLKTLSFQLISRGPDRLPAGRAENLAPVGEPDYFNHPERRDNLVYPASEP